VVSQVRQTYANGLRRRRPRPGDQWHLDEVFIKINGKTHYLWRAVDQDGTVLDILVTSRRDTKAVGCQKSVTCPDLDIHVRR
jgi:putative transposase